MPKAPPYIILFVILNLFIGCSGPYTYNDNGKTKELSEDDDFQIVLKGGENSDFNWRLISIPDFIKLEKTDLVEGKGLAVDYVFDFKTTSFGNDIVKLIYTDGNTVKKTFEVNIVAGTMGIITSE